LYIRYTRQENKVSGGGNVRAALTHWASFALLLVTFLGVLSPYLRESKQIWGKYFFNVNTTFYMWYDTFTEAKQGTRAHGEGEGWPNMPPDEIPSLHKYLREHTPAQILERIRIGLGLQARTLWSGYGLFNFHLFYLAVLLVLTVLLWRQNQALIRSQLALIVFSMLYFAGYIFSIAWYYPIGGGENQRFTFALFVSFMFAVFLAVDKMLAGVESVRLLGKEIPTAKLKSGLNWFVSLALAMDILFYVPIRLQQIVF
jgi:hypothetical protein